MTATQHDAGTNRKTAEAGTTPGAKTSGTAKTEAPKTHSPKTEAPKTEAPKTEAPKTEAHKTEAHTAGVSGPGFEIPAFDIPSVEATTKRIRDLNERIIESSKSAGLVTLDTYEKALQSLVDFETKVASGSQLEWVSALATTHAKFISDLSASYTKAARDLLG